MSAQRKCNTVKGLVEHADRLRRERGLSYYEVARRSGLSLGTVTRFFTGYQRMGSRMASRVADPDKLGPVTLGTALAVIQACGGDLAFVVISES